MPHIKSVIVENKFSYRLWMISRGTGSPYLVKGDEVDFYYCVQSTEKDIFPINCGYKYWYIKQKQNFRELSLKEPMAWIKR